MEKIRNNNDLEGWHHRLNYKAKRCQLQFYLLIELLHREGSLVTMQTKLVSTGKLRRQQCKKYKRIQGSLKKFGKGTTKYQCRSTVVILLTFNCLSCFPQTSAYDVYIQRYQFHDVYIQWYQFQTGVS